MSYEINLITKLYKFCEDKKYKLSIAGCSIENYKNEKKFYKQLLPQGEWNFFRKKVAHPCSRSILIYLLKFGVVFPPVDRGATPNTDK